MNEKPTQTLKEVLTDALEAQGLNIGRLAELTDIPERYLIALRDNDIKKLPAAPYVRGYLMKIAEVLDIDGRPLWELYKTESPVKTSGVEDRLPVNRFAIKPRSKKLLIFGLMLLLGIIYLAWRSNDLFGTPQIEIVNPVVNNFVTKDSSVKLRGIVNPKDKLMINGEEIIVDPNGRFEKDFTLQTGVNTVEFKVQRLLGQTATILRQIIYQP